MVQIDIGCAGWNYKDWIGPFYPKSIESSHQLEFYSQFFDVVEINSTFYNLPTKSMVNNWLTKVPNYFRYIVKVWQEISHKLHEFEIDYKINQFFSRMKPLEDKMVGYLFQFPPWFQYSEEHVKRLSYLINDIPINNKLKYIFEFRDNSWFKPDILNKFLDGKEQILGTTYKPNLNPYYLPHQEYYYIRLIGDRELNVFNRVQRQQENTLRDLLGRIDAFRKNPEIYEIFIIVNNHFMGFAPETVNLLKKLLNLPLKNYNQQKRLTDFFI
ncbi:MAG: DUF72 domain-containing protein [Candidatus Hodarchaeota archaeon]